MLTNEQRTNWILSQAGRDEKPTGNQTGTILEGSESLVYLGVTGKGLTRPFRVQFRKGMFPYYVVFSVFDPTFAEFHPTLIHWTKALHYLRTYDARHSVEKVLWNDGMKDGWTSIKWTRYTREDRFSLEGIMNGGTVMMELPAIPEAL